MLYSLNAHRRTKRVAPSIIRDIGWPREAANLSFHQISAQRTFSQLNQLAAGGPHVGRGLATPGLGADTVKNFVMAEV